MTIRHTLLKPSWRFLAEESGATTVEYAVMLAMILMAVIVTVQSLGQNQDAYWGNIDGEMQAHGIK